MQKLKLTLIALLWSCLVFSQNDSTFCFTKGQVKEFLRTKVELNNCLDRYNLLSLDLDSVKQANNTLIADNTKLEKRAVRRLRIGLIVGGVGGVAVGILTGKLIK